MTIHPCYKVQSEQGESMGNSFLPKQENVPALRVRATFDTYAKPGAQKGQRKRRKTTKKKGHLRRSSRCAFANQIKPGKGVRSGF